MSNRSLGTLTLDLIAKTGGFREGMTAAERAAEKANQKIRKETAETIDSVVNFGKQSVIAFTAVSAALGVMTLRSVEAVAAQQDLAETLGTSQASLARLTRAADLSGVSSDELAGAMKKLNNAIGEGLNGSKAANESFAKLGLTAQELSSMNVEERFATISDALMQVSDQTLRAESAQNLFGKTGQNLLPMLQNGSESLREAADQANRFGLALSEIDARNIAAADDSISNLRALFDGFGTQLAAKFAPAITVFSEELIDATGETETFASTVFTSFENIIKAGSYVGDLLEGFISLFMGLTVSVNATSVAFSGFLGFLNVLGGIGKDEFGKRVEETADAIDASVKRLNSSIADLHVQLSSKLPHEEVDAFFAKVREMEKTVAVPENQPFVTMNGEGPVTGMLPAKPEDDIEAQAAKLAEQLEAQDALEESYHQAKMSRIAEELAAEVESGELTAESWRIATEAKAKEYQKNADFFVKGLNTIAQGQGKASKAARALQLADALWEVAINTKKMAVAAYGAMVGIPVIGPALAVAAAGAAIAFGGAIASELTSGSRGRPSPPSAGVASSSYVPPTFGNAGNEAATRAPTNMDITIVGKGMPSWEQVAELMQMVGERMADNGGRMGKVTILTAA